MKKALITGITGQDGSYPAEFLLSKGYEVHGSKRRASLFNTERIDHIYEDPHAPHPKLKLHYGDLTDTRVQYSVRAFIDKAVRQLGIELAWKGAGVNENARVAVLHGDRAPAMKIGHIVVKIDPRYFRPAEVKTLLGDPTKAREKLGWVPKITLDEMIEEMVAYDLDKARQHAMLKNQGFKVSVGRE